MPEEPPRPAHLPPGYDEEDPYEGVDISTYPEWWRRNVETFREHNLRPYRPPRFADDEITTEWINDLSKELGVEIQFRTANPRSSNNWELVVDDEQVTTVEHYREGEGYSRYSLTSDEFESLVNDAVEK